MDKDLHVSVRRGRQQAHTQHNCRHTNRMKQFRTKISVLPCRANTMQYFDFSKRYKILNDRRGYWYYSCYVVWHSEERASFGECHADIRDACLCSAAMRISHATRRNASTLHFPAPRRSRGSHGLRGLPAT